MSRIYGQLVERFGFREVRELSTAEVEHFCRYRSDGNEATQQEDADVPDFGAPREISEQEWKAKCEREKSYAAEQNGRRNPFL